MNVKQVEATPVIKTVKARAELVEIRGRRSILMIEAGNANEKYVMDPTFKQWSIGRWCWH